MSPPKSEPFYPRPYILYPVSCAAYDCTDAPKRAGWCYKHWVRPKTVLLCSELRGPAAVGDALGLESRHKAALHHRERLSGCDREWHVRSACVCAAHDGRHVRIRTARQQLLQLVCKLLGRKDLPSR